MLTKLRRHLSYANVTATLALFVALGGTSALALSGSNTVFSDDIANDNFNSPTEGQGGLVASDLRAGSVGGSEVADSSLTGTDIFNNTVSGADITNGSLSGADVFDNTIGGADVTNNSLSGADINESSLAKVPDADQLDGVDSSAFQRVGLVQARSADQTESEGFPFLASWDELAHITTDGDADQDNTIRILNTGSQDIGVRSDEAAGLLGPGGVVTRDVDNFTPFIVFSADGVRSWQVTCLSDLFTVLIRCHGVANRVG